MDWTKYIKEKIALCNNKKNKNIEFGIIKYQL